MFAVAKMRQTKIVATLGPASDSGDTVRALIEAGVDVCRLNLSHGSRDEHASRIRAVRRAAGDLQCRVGILLDLQGPKIRLGTFAGGECTLTAGQAFTITTEPVTGSCGQR